MPQPDTNKSLSLSHVSSVKEGGNVNDKPILPEGDEHHSGIDLFNEEVNIESPLSSFHGEEIRVRTATEPEQHVQSSSKDLEAMELFR